MKKIKKIGAIILVLIGLSLALYPWISEFLYENQVDTILYEYEDVIEETDTSELDEMLQAAYEYNDALLHSNVTLTDPFTIAVTSDSRLDYYSILNLTSRGVMAFIDIPKIDVYLPVYHGTDATTLEYGVGHLENTSLPVGGESTHAVLSGHSGLNSAKLFTDLTSLEEGDLFFIHILSETLAYRVCDINVVEPDDTSLLTIQQGKDLVTLVTCTPYGVNTHRLLVTGERTEYTEEIEAEAEEQETIITGSQWMNAYRTAVLIAVAIILAIVIIGLLYKRHRVRQRILRR